MLYVVRHGETEPNVRGVVLGRADPVLTDRGLRQAAQLGASLPHPDLVLSSPLSRARATAAAFGRPVGVDERWIERDYGILEGVADPRLVPNDVNHVPAGGESIGDVGQRVRDACEDLRSAASTGTVVVVTHVSPVKAAIAWALGVDDAIAWRLWVEDAAVARIAIGPEGPVLRSFNEHPWPPS